MKSSAVVVAILTVLAGRAFGASCEQKVPRHERHVTTAAKKEVFRRAGVPYDRAHRPLYVVDHILPLELGGINQVSNLQLQNKEQGHCKDLVENFLARCVCRSSTPLPLAQALVRDSWKSVLVGAACPKGSTP